MVDHASRYYSRMGIGGYCGVGAGMTRDTPRDRIAAFLKQHRNRNGVDPERIMGLNMGTQNEAELRASDLDAVLADQPAPVRVES
jgi:hypothetical protein